MHTIDDPGDALAVLHDPGFVVPPVPAAPAAEPAAASAGPAMAAVPVASVASVASAGPVAATAGVPGTAGGPVAGPGIAWLRATVGRFSTGAAHTRRRALGEGLLSTVEPAALRAAGASSPHLHPVQLLCNALGIESSVVDEVRTAAAAYQPGTGDEAAADKAVQVLVGALGAADEPTAALIGLLVQACAATTALITEAGHAGLDTALRTAAAVPTTKRMAIRPTDVGGTRVEAGEVVLVSLAGIPFGAGPRACPGRAHALAIAEGILSALPAPESGGHPR